MNTITLVLTNLVSIVTVIIIGCGIPLLTIDALVSVIVPMLGFGATDDFILIIALLLTGFLAITYHIIATPRSGK